MDRVSLSELLEAVQGTPIRLFDADRTFERVSIDSRQVQAGDVFWAIGGDRFDGHDFVSEALSRGAAACVVNRVVDDHCRDQILVPDTRSALMRFAGSYREKLETLIIGVTGSVGKTTTREMLYRVLSRKFHGIRSGRNYNNELGVPLTLLEINSAHEFAVVEMGARRIGDIAALCEIARPEVGVITGISEAHLETFGSLEQIRQGKGELFQSLPPRGFGILGGELPNVSGLAESANCPVLRVGTDELSDLQAKRVSFEKGRLSFEIEGSYYEVCVPGRHFLTAALCAVGVAREIGMSPQEIAEGLAEFRPVEGRASVERVGEWTVIDDTYNASPSSMSAACEVLEAISPVNHRVLVIGDMLELGTESKRLHRELGLRIGEHHMDRVIAFGPCAGEVASGAFESGFPACQFGETGEIETVKLLLDCWLERDDAILVKGSRGMGMERIITWLRAESERRRATETAVEIRERSVA